MPRNEEWLGRLDLSSFVNSYDRFGVISGLVKSGCILIVAPGQ